MQRTKDSQWTRVVENRVRCLAVVDTVKNGRVR